MPVTKTEVQLANERFFEMLGDSSMQKQAEDAISKFTRTKIREEGFTRRILPPLKPDRFDRQLHTSKPFIVIDKEPDNPPAVTVPYGTWPTSFHILGPRYGVGFERVQTPRAIADMSELDTWTMDIRQVMSDNMLKDMHAEEDSKFIGAVNTALISAGGTVPTSGAIQWRVISGGITRETHKTAKQTMPATVFRLMPSIMLTNMITIVEYEKWGRDEVGGNASEDMLINGWSMKKFDGLDVLITIKRDLVPDNTTFLFADPKFIGKFFYRENATMYVKREAFMLEWFLYEEIGASIGHTGGLVRIDHTA